MGTLETSRSTGKATETPRRCDLAKVTQCTCCGHQDSQVPPSLQPHVFLEEEVSLWKKKKKKEVLRREDSPHSLALSFRCTAAFAPSAAGEAGLVFSAACFPFANFSSATTHWYPLNRLPQKSWQTWVPLLFRKQMHLGWKPAITLVWLMNPEHSVPGC